MKADVRVGQVDPGAVLSSKSRKWPGSRAYPTGGRPTLALFGNFGIGTDAWHEPQWRPLRPGVEIE